MLFKACTRCGGDVFDETDMGQIDLVCLQCGFRRTVNARWDSSEEESENLMRWLQTQRPTRAAA